MHSTHEKRLARTVILAIAVVIGLSVSTFWADGVSVVARLAGGLVAAVVSYFAARLMVS